jgi:Spy/CpxP family protein refolding chaperone
MLRSALRALTLAALLATPSLAQEPPAPAPTPGQGNTPQPRPQGDPPRPGPEGGRRGGPPWGNANFGKDATEYLTKELDLDAKQQELVKGIFDGAMRDIMKKMAEAWGADGPPDPSQMRSVYEDMRVDLSRKINEILSPDQRREFDVLVDQFDRRSQSWEQGRAAAEDPTRMFDPPPISRRVLLEKAERSLFLGPDETLAVMPLVEKCVDLLIAFNEGKRTRRDDLRSAIEGGAKDQEVRQRIDALRDAAQFQELELVAARQALRDVLTIEQEVRLVAMGILD